MTGNMKWSDKVKWWFWPHGWTYQNMVNIAVFGQKPLNGFDLAHDTVEPRKFEEASREADKYFWRSRHNSSKRFRTTSSAASRSFTAPPPMANSCSIPSAGMKRMTAGKIRRQAKTTEWISRKAIGSGRRADNFNRRKRSERRNELRFLGYLLSDWIEPFLASRIPQGINAGGG